jgi:hypothetical protein
MTSLEKAARALIEWDEAQHETGWYGFDPNDAIDIARAVLLAVREPGDDALWAGRAINTSADFTWVAMIDAILQEKGDG